MVFPLVALAFFSVFFGYFTKDLFSGLGTGFFTDNSIFIHPHKEIILATEFAVPTFFKLLPFFCTVFFSILVITLFEFFPGLIVKFKLSGIGYYIFGFFNQRGFIEMFYNNLIVNLVLILGGHTTKILDKGSIELVGLSTEIIILVYELVNVFLFITILIAFIFAPSSSGFRGDAFVPFKTIALNTKPHILLASSVFPINVTNNVLASTKSADKPAVVSVKIYNFYSDKKQILLENNGKAGVYCFKNLVNGKIYIGSSSNLGDRLRDYYSLRYLERQIINNKSMIYRSIIKYGYSSFILEILEYCDRNEAVTREQYYLNLLKAEYNILKIAGSSLGFKHSEETKIKLRDLTPEKKAKRLEQLKRSNANPESQAKNLEHLKRLNSSPEQKEHLKRLHANPEIKAKRLEHLKNLHSIQSHKVSVLDTLTNKTTVYLSISEAAKTIGVHPGNISRSFKRLKEKGVSTI
jgi:group I intron endonuclease